MSGQFVYDKMTMSIGADGEPGWRFRCRLQLFEDCSGYANEARRRAQARLETHFGMLSR